MIGTIPAGSTGQFGVQLLLNGSVAPAASIPSGYSLNPSWSADDANVSFAPATSDASNGAIPLEDQVVMTVPSTDTSANATVKASATAPDGSAMSATITVGISQAPPPPQQWSLGISQLA